MSHVPHPPHPTEHVDPHDPHQRVAALCIVLATLAAAVVGYLLAVGSHHAERAGVEGQQLGVRAMSSALSAQQTAQADFQNFLLAQEQQREAANALQQGLLAPADERRPFDLERERWDALAAETGTLTTIRQDGPTGPERDPRFPSRFFTASSFDSVRLQALQDSANSYSGAWNSRTSSYTAILTIFAVALYLAGFSLTFPQRIKRILSRVGIGLLVIGVLWAAVVVALPPKRPPQQAAVEYARGHVELLNAASPADYRTAIDHFTKAIDLRPGYARAYLERGSAEFLAGSPDPGAYKIVTAPHALERSVADFQRAYDEGLQDFLGLWDLGAGQILLGINGHDEGHLAEGIDFTRTALEDKPEEPVLHYNLGLAMLASGDTEGAQAEYRSAITRTVYSNVANKTPRGQFFQELEVAAALTGLDQLALHDATLAGQVKAMKQLVVSAVSQGRPDLRGATSSPAVIGPMTADAFPGALQVSGITASNYDPQRDVVSLQWYQRSPGRLGWAVIPQASGTVPLVQDDARPGTYFVLSDYLRASSPPQCLTETEYRAELYVNGKLVRTSTVTANFHQLNLLNEAPQPLVAALSGDLNVAYCRPTSWHHMKDRVPGLLDGYLSPDGSKGVYLFRVDYPDSYDVLLPATRATQIGDIIMSDPQYQKLFPDTPKAVPGTITERQFMGISGGRARTYFYGGLGGGEVETHAVDTGSGAVIMAAVFGSHAYIQLQSQRGSLLDSMTLYR